jgi:hypothetical protein
VERCTPASLATSLMLMRMKVSENKRFYEIVLIIRNKSNNHKLFPTFS